MSDKLGGAVIGMAVDADGVDVGIERTKGKIGSLADIAARANETVSKSTERLVNRLEMQNATLNMSAREAKLYELEMKGVGKAQLAHVDSLMKSIDANKRASDALNNTGISAKQTAAAMRGVPAQFTDIVTSLQGGQAPLTVLLQQGGQLKDMFGGAGNATKALGSYVLGLISPFSIAAVTIGTLGVAAYLGSKEQDAYARALILTGNAAGSTINQMAGMAQAISKTSSFTQSAAAGAIAAFASDGNTSAANLQKFATVALKLEKETGVAVADTVKQFAELGKDPLAASLKLNESTRHLTMEQYNLIRSLTEQGKAAEAAKVAQESWATAMTSRTDALQANLGYLEKAWRGLGDGAKTAWDKMKGLGREDTVEEKIEKEQKKFESRTAAQQYRDGQRGLHDKPIAADKPENISLLKKGRDLQESIATEAKKASDAAQAKMAWDTEGLKYLTTEQKLRKEIQKQEELGKKANLSTAEIGARTAAIRRQAQGAGFDDGIAKAKLALELSTIQAALDQEKNAYSNQDKVLSAMRSGKLISDKDYFNSKLALIELGRDAEDSALQAEIDRAKAIKFTGDNRVQQEIANADKIVKLESKLAIAKANSANALALHAMGVVDHNKKIEQSYLDAVKAAKLLLEQTQRGYARQADGIGKGNEYRERKEKLGQIEETKIAKVASLDTDLQKKTITQEEYDEQTRIATQSAQDQTDAYLQSIDTMKAGQADWTNGVSEALANLTTEWQNVAKQWENITTNAMTGISSGIGNTFADAIVDGKSLGKGLESVFRNVAKQAIASFVQMGVQHAMTKGAILLQETITGARAVAIQATASNSITGIKGKETIEVVTGNAAQAASGAAAAVAPTPFIGPGLAFAAGAAMMAFVMSMVGKSKGGAYEAVTTVNKNPYPTNIAVPVAGQRASGGAVNAGGLYEVNERGTEMFSSGGRDYLMVGQQGGYVTPNSQLQGKAAGNDVAVSPSHQATSVEIKVHAMPGAYAKDFFMVHRDELGKALASGRKDRVKGY